MFLGAEENRRIGGGEVEQMGEALFLDQRAIADLDQMVAAARVLSSLGGGDWEGVGWQREGDVEVRREKREGERGKRREEIRQARREDERGKGR